MEITRRILIVVIHANYFVVHYLMFGTVCVVCTVVRVHRGVVLHFPLRHHCIVELADVAPFGWGLALLRLVLFRTMSTNSFVGTFVFSRIDVAVACAVATLDHTDSLIHRAILVADEHFSQFGEFLNRAGLTSATTYLDPTRSFFENFILKESSVNSSNPGLDSLM